MSDAERERERKKKEKVKKIVRQLLSWLILIDILRDMAPTTFVNRFFPFQLNRQLSFSMKYPIQQWYGWLSLNRKKRRRQKQHGHRHKFLVTTTECANFLSDQRLTNTNQCHLGGQRTILILNRFAIRSNWCAWFDTNNSNKNSCSHSALRRLRQITIIYLLLIYW